VFSLGTSTTAGGCRARRGTRRGFGSPGLGAAGRDCSAPPRPATPAATGQLEFAIVELPELPARGAVGPFDVAVELGGARGQDKEGNRPFLTGRFELGHERAAPIDLDGPYWEGKILRNRFSVGELPSGTGGRVPGKRDAIIALSCCARAEAARTRNTCQPRRVASRGPVGRLRLVKAQESGEMSAPGCGIDPAVCREGCNLNGRGRGWRHCICRWKAAMLATRSARQAPVMPPRRRSRSSRPVPIGRARCGSGTDWDHG
jgi:hypothetical protein